MSRIFLISSLAILFLTVTSCGLFDSTAAVSGLVSPPHSMSIGSSDDGIVVEFMEVASDSRCPRDVECPTAGKAQVVLGLTVDSGQRDVVKLDVVSGSGASYKAGKYTIEFPRLLPDRPPVEGVPQERYQLELRIEQN